jgi:hypothetical protein
LHLSAGQTQIEVQKGNLSDCDAQMLVSVIDDRGKGAGNPMFKKVIHNDVAKAVSITCRRSSMKVSYDWGMRLQWG